MTKTDIENCAISGLPLSGRDVARVSRKHRGVVTLRHVWPEDVDARVWAGVREAVYDLAATEARRIGHPVEIYAADGYMLDQISHED